VVALATDLIISSVPVERAGVVSGLSETSTEVGAALGIALLGSIATAVYRGQLTDVPASAAARRTPAMAVHAADYLSPPLRAALNTTARGAFTDGLRIAVTLSAAMTVAMALAVVATLRRRRSAASESDRVTQPDEWLGVGE
jgi:MFS transporter, DHA2 family, multidrug resistance protein